MTLSQPVGGYHSNESFLTPLLVEHWSGSHWAIQRAPSPSGGMGNSLQSVSCTSATACLAVGANFDSFYTWQTLAERYG